MLAVFAACLILGQPTVAPAAETRLKTGAATSADTKNYSFQELVGDYAFGNGLDMNFELEITADGHFNYEQASYEGLQAQAAGRVSLRHNRLVLTPTAATPEAWPRGMGLELTPVSWGERTYLIPDKDMMSFVNAVNRGSEPVQQISRGTFFLREGDIDKVASGHPALPGRYATLLLNKPLNGRVLASDKAGEWRVDLGKAAGVHPGMELCAWSPDEQQCVTVVVCKVEDSCCFVQTPKVPAAPLLNWKVCSRQRAE
jgi:hypothetical protein